MDGPGAEDFEAVGLYDPTSPDAAEKLELLRYLSSVGVSIERMLARDETYLVSLGFDVTLEAGDISAGDIAERLDVPVEKVVEAYRLVGVEVPDTAAPVFDESEAEFVSLLRAALTTFPEDALQEILRALSSAMATLASAAITAYVGSVEDEVARAGPAAQARVTTGVAELGLGLGATLPQLFRHHLRSSVEFQRSVMRATEDRQTSTMAVGFVDLVGYTSTTESMAATDLVRFVGGFRARTHDLVTSMGGRVVKHIGDEIMFSSARSGDACRIGLALIAGFGDIGVVPRGGVAHGSVVARHGDLYGPVVNLASRLTDIAVPGELLAPASIEASLADCADLCTEAAGRRQLKGFPDPVSTVTVVRAAG